jgi:hypothetical protein
MSATAMTHGYTLIWIGLGRSWSCWPLIWTRGRGFPLSAPRPDSVAGVVGLELGNVVI